MSDQREMTLDEYLESKLPDFHLARRQLQELREERDALAAQVEAIDHPATLFIESAQDAIELLEAAGEARNIVDLRQDLAKAADGLTDALNNTPATSLARRDAEKQAEARNEGMLQGGVMAAALMARQCEVTAREVLHAFGVTTGEDLRGCAEYDIARLIEHRVQIPGLHAVWQEARREERRQSEEPTE